MSDQNDGVLLSPPWHGPGCSLLRKTIVVMNEGGGSYGTKGAST